MNLKYGYLLIFCKRSNPKWKKLNNKIWYTFMAFVPVPHFGTCIILPHHLIYSSIRLDDVFDRSHQGYPKLLSDEKFGNSKKIGGLWLYIDTAGSVASTF